MLISTIRPNILSDYRHPSKECLATHQNSFHSLHVRQFPKRSINHRGTFYSVELTVVII